jgi:hypothetical protein
MMAVNTIILKGGNHQIEVTLDAIASPGMAIELAADGKYDPVASAQAEALKQGIQPVLIEDGLQGKTVDDAYASGDKAQAYQAVAGDHLQVLVKDGETIAVADKLVVEGGGSGLFVEAAGSETAYQVKALEAVSPSGSNGLCKVVVL